MTGDRALRAHHNLADFYRWFPALDPGATLLDPGDGVVSVAGTNDWPSDRLALRTDDSLRSEEWVARTDAFLGARGKGACVFTRVGADDDLIEPLTEAEFFEYGETPEMWCVARLPEREPAERTTVHLATSPDDIAAYAAVAANAFVDLGMLEAPLRDLLDHPATLLDRRVAVAIGELDGEPVAGAMSVLLGDDPLGYVGWVACRSEARGHRLGDTVTRLVTNEAFDRGATAVTLEASKFGESTYRRMGFEELYRYRMMVRMR